MFERRETLTTVDVAGWAQRIAIAVVFVGVGSAKFAAHSQWTGIFNEIGLGDWFRYLTGTLQVLGGLLFLIPQTIGVGALLAGCTMVGAVVVHLVVLDTGIGGAIFPLGLLVFLTVVALRRVE